MTHRSLLPPSSGLRVFSASLLSALMIMMPFVQMAAASRRSEVRDQRSERGTSPTPREGSKTAAENVFVDPALPGPVAVPLVPSITATMTDTLINDDGDSKADPTNGVPATTEKIRYTVTISNAGGATDATNVQYTNTIDSHTELVPGSITTQPLAGNDSFNVLGNVRIQVPDGSSDLLGNDCDPDPAGGPCTNAGLTASGPTTGPANGQVTVNSDGSFSYNPNPGYTGADSFTYTVTDATGKTDTATVNLTISGMIWFVDDSAGGGGDGRLTSPFNCLTGAGCFNLVAADDPGDNIFLYSGTYNNTSVFALMDTQKLIGQGSSSGTTLAAIAGVTVPTHSDALPPLNNDPSTVTVNSTAAGVQLEQDNTLRGFTVGNTIGTGSFYDIQNTTTQTVGTLNISEVILSGTGGLFRADSGGALSVTFNSAATTDAGGNGIQIVNATGSFTVNGAGAISGVDGADVLISGGTATIAISSSISNTFGRAVDIQDRSGNPIGGITFSGAITDNGGLGIFLDDNDQGGGNGAVTFSGGLTLNPAASTTAFTATNGGIVNVSGTNNITATGTGLGINWNGDTSASPVTFNNVTSATGAAVTIQNSGATDFTFNDITSGAASAVTLNTATGDFIFHAIHSNGAAKGISVTSATGTFTVNGTSTTDGTGGTIQNATSRGAEFISSNNITLKNMNFTNNGVGGNDLNCGDALGASTNTAFVTGAACESNIHLQSTTTVVLNNVNANDGDAHGINGVAVNGLTLTNVEAQRNGSMVGEDGVQLVNLSGTVSVTGGIFKDNASRSFEVQNNSGSPTITMTSNAFGNTNFPTAGGTAPSPSNSTAASTVLLATNGNSGAFMTSVVTGNTFTNVFSIAFHIDMADGNNRQNVTFGQAGGGNGNTITNANQGVSMVGTNDASTSLTASVVNNTLSNDETVMDTFSSTNINFRRGGGGGAASGNWDVTIDNNTVGISGNTKSGCETVLCFGISADDQGSPSGTFTVLIQNNDVYNVGGGIQVGSANAGAHTLRATIINNLVQQPDTAPQGGSGASEGNGIFIFSGTAATATTYAKIEDNDVDGGWDQVGNGDAIRLRHAGAAGSQFFLCNFLLASSAANVATHLANENPLTSDADGGGATFSATGASIGAGLSVQNGCPLVIGEGGVEADSDFALFTKLAFGYDANATMSLTQPQLDSIVAAVKERWAATGLTAKQIAAMREMKFEVGDLANTFLGAATGNRITVDRDAQGKGWFVDTTPADDLEFGDRSSATRRYTNPYTAAAGRIDLLTAIAHEIGHKLGLDDSYAEKDRDSIMYGYLTMGERRVPAQGEASNARPGSLTGTHYLRLKEVAAEGSKRKAGSRNNHAATSRAVTATISGETITIIIGTLRPGDSVTITYDVTVNNPPDLNNPVNPLVVTQPAVATQGSVSYNDGATPQTPVLTDDSALIGSSDPTATEVDLFDTTTSLSCAPDPSNSGDQVTCTATLTESETLSPAGTVDFIDTSNGNAIICDDAAVASNQATCQTSSLAAGTHNIRADYSGDGNFDSSQSNLYAQDVVACTTNPVVTTNADSGANSLRQAILDACNGTTIDFNITGDGPHTITLTTGELALTKNVTIQNTSGESVTVSGNNASRVFNINSGKTVTIRDLTVTGGSSVGSGGGILNDHGTLTLTNMTVSGSTAPSGGGVSALGTTGSASLTIINSTISTNTSTTSGGGIFANGIGGAVTLIISNSTISGNNADLHGGGLALTSATSTLTNVTVTNNRADNNNDGSGSGGGVTIIAGTMVTLHNAIVAGNLNEDGVADARDDVNGALQAASSFNLIGDGTGMTGITNGSNDNQVGTGVSPINAMLGPLASNGGPTQTHALLATSPAIEAGSNANLPVDTFDVDGDSDFAETLPVDQRGVGYPRKADSADLDTTQTVDIGAFELHPSIENIADQNTNEDTAKMVTFNLGDDTGTLITGGGGSVAATSSNTSVVANAGLGFSGSGGSRTLTITPVANASGVTTITVTVTATNGRTAQDTFDLTVNAQNDNPTITNNTGLTVNEASTGNVIDNTKLRVDDVDNTAAQVTFTVGTAPANGTLKNNGVDLSSGGTFTQADIDGSLLTYDHNGSETTSDSFTFTVSDGAGGTIGTTTFNITVTAQNDPPTLTTNAGLTVLNGGTGTIDNTKLKVDDADNTAAQLTFTVGTATTNGTLKKGVATVSAGDMFTQADIDGNQITYTHNGTATMTDSFTFTVSDGAGGSIGSTTFNITIGSPNVSIHDAKVAEPSSGSIDMVFTVALAAPAGGSGASVNFTTAPDALGANPATAGSCPGADYTTTSGTVNFSTGEQVKTINVPICSDGLSEPDETFLVNLSGAVNATILDDQATGTITVANPAGAVLISELRTSGPGGDGDDFVEIYNNTNLPLTVTASDASAGYGLYKMGADCNATPILIGVIPNGEVIPARGHYLLVGSGYSLANYGGTGAAAGNLTFTADIETDANVGLFSTSDVTAISSANRLDAVGFGLNTGGTCNLLREGSTLPPISLTPLIEHSYFRKMCDWIQGQGCTVPGVPKDTNNNSADFWLADTAGSAITGRLGAPGPENLASPIRRDNAGINVFILDGTVGSGANPNRHRDGGDPDGAFGTMTLRYRVTNNTGGNVTRLRYRIVDISTAIQSGGPTADLRALTSSVEPGVGPINDPVTCVSQSLGTPCTVTVTATTLEQPPTQSVGGGYNSTLSSGTVTLGTPLANGNSILINFKLGVAKTGTFRFYIIVEALP